MPNTLKIFFTRTITASILAISFILAFTFLSKNGIKILISIITSFLVLEYVHLILPQAKKKLKNLLAGLYITSYLICLFIIQLSNNESLITTVIAIVPIYIVISFWIFCHESTHNIIEYTGLTILGLFYIIWPAILLINILEREPNGFAWLAWLLLVIFTGDIFAYLTGSIWNSKKWMPYISPNKSYGGLMSGLLFSGFMSIVVLMYFNGTGTKAFFYFILGAICFFIAQTGDLWVSTLKRRAGLKDTGNWLPGHGGWLDRLDGVLIALPISYHLAFFYFSVHINP